MIHCINWVKQLWKETFQFYPTDKVKRSYNVCFHIFFGRTGVKRAFNMPLNVNDSKNLSLQVQIEIVDARWFFWNFCCRTMAIRLLRVNNKMSGRKNVRWTRRRRRWTSGKVKRPPPISARPNRRCARWKCTTCLPTREKTIVPSAWIRL